MRVPTMVTQRGRVTATPVARGSVAESSAQLLCFHRHSRFVRSFWGVEKSRVESRGVARPRPCLLFSLQPDFGYSASCLLNSLTSGPNSLFSTTFPVRSFIFQYRKPGFTPRLKARKGRKAPAAHPHPSSSEEGSRGSPSLDKEGSGVVDFQLDPLFS